MDERGGLTRIISLNCNGIRAAVRKGLYEWLNLVQPDIVCLQETKAHVHQLPLDAGILSSYHAESHDAIKRGYSGVAIYSRVPPLRVERGFGYPAYDAEGRYVQMDFEHVSVASFYMPSGAAGRHRQAHKEAFLELFSAWLRKRRNDGRSYILGGDFNVAYGDIDVYDPKRLGGISGFMPHERAWMRKVLDQGWTDALRTVKPDERGIYTWWSNFQGAFQANRGWRIDYQLLTPDLAPAVRNAWVYVAQRFSDHAPVVVDYDLEL